MTSRDIFAPQSQHLTEADVIRIIDDRLQKLGLPAGRSCFRCEFYAPVTRDCFKHGGQVPPEFVIQGCDQFTQGVPF